MKDQLYMDRVDSGWNCTRTTSDCIGMGYRRCILNIEARGTVPTATHRTNALVVYCGIGGNNYAIEDEQGDCEPCSYTPSHQSLRITHFVRI